MESTLYSLLKDNTAIAAIVAERIYPAGTVVQDAAKPYLFFKVDRFPSQDISGAITITRYETEIHCITATSKAGIDLMQAASNVLIESDLNISIDKIEAETWSEGDNKDFKQVMYINIYA